ncbi:hypothetical protein E4U39_006075 [Claviceps sp. Clav50 group G5]|nr:hypothetical protein E4U39_006075 [Claviceps sp. Clav50 group G5]
MQLQPLPTNAPTVTPRTGSQPSASARHNTMQVELATGVDYTRSLSGQPKLN